MRSIATCACLLLGSCVNDYQLGVLDDEVHLKPEPPDLGATVIEDVLRQRVPDLVDVLWVIDNSSSMLAEQRKLAENFDRFIDFYRNSGLDWHVGVVSTDMGDPDQAGKLQPGGGYLWVDPTVADPAAVFSEIAVLGRDGSRVERGRAAVYAAFNDPEAAAHNEGFFRDEAVLSVIIVSDEDDKSGNEPTLEEFSNWLLALKPDPEMVVVSAIVGLDVLCGQNEEGLDYRALVEQTNGIEFDICEEDWTPILEELGISIVGLERVFYLSRLPDPSTLEVWIEDNGETFEFVQGDDYAYNVSQNAIRFGTYTPRATAEVHVRYEVLGAQEGDK